MNDLPYGAYGLCFGCVLRRERCSSQGAVCPVADDGEVADIALGPKRYMKNYEYLDGKKGRLCPLVIFPNPLAHNCQQAFLLDWSTGRTTFYAVMTNCLTAG
eukprot:90067-Amphidinium_carterae.1